MAHTAIALITVRALNDVANGRLGVGFDTPLDLMDRVKGFNGVVSINGWELLAKLFECSPYLTPSVESDYLWLDRDNEDIAIDAAEDKMKLAKDEAARLSWREVRNDLRRMADHRRGLGLNGLTWEIS